MNLLVEIIVLIEFKNVYVHIPFFFTTNKILKYDKFHAKILNVLNVSLQTIIICGFLFNIALGRQRRNRRRINRLS